MPQSEGGGAGILNLSTFSYWAEVNKYKKEKKKEEDNFETRMTAVVLTQAFGKVNSALQKK